MILDTWIKVIVGIFIGVQTCARLLSISDNSFGLETLSAPSLLSFYISKKKRFFEKIDKKQTHTHSLAHALIVSPWPSWPGWASSQGDPIIKKGGEPAF